MHKKKKKKKRNYLCSLQVKREKKFSQNYKIYKNTKKC